MTATPTKPTPEEVATLAHGLRWDLAGEVVRAQSPRFRPDSAPQIMQATAAQAVEMWRLGLHVARNLTPLGTAVRAHLLGEREGATRD